jgi:hypothetical protein
VRVMVDIDDLRTYHPERTQEHTLYAPFNVV